MGQYRVIVVDDEEEIREGIIRKIDWNALGYEVVGSAENGVEALELAEHLHPDVIMTDIKMSFMDGLQLCQHIAEKMPSVKMIIFSGFDDFEYAQRAIKLNVTEYLLKPGNAQELTQTLQKVILKSCAEIIKKACLCCGSNFWLDSWKDVFHSSAYKHRQKCSNFTWLQNIGRSHWCMQREILHRLWPMQRLFVARRSWFRFPWQKRSERFWGGFAISQVFFIWIMLSFWRIFRVITMSLP